MSPKYKPIIPYIPVMNIFAVLYYLMYAAKKIRKRFKFVLFVFLFGFSASLAQRIGVSFQKPMINWLVFIYVCYFMPMIICIVAEKTMFAGKTETDNGSSETEDNSAN